MDFALLSVLTLVCADPGLALSSPPVGEPVVLAAAIQVEAVVPVKVSPDAVDAAPAVLLPEQAPLAFVDLSDEEVVERVLTALDSVTTLEGDFTQIAPSGAVSTGEFHLRRPGLLRFEYDPPTPLLIVANGGLVYVRDEALETTDSYPVNKTPLKFLLRKKVEMGDAKLVDVIRGVDDLAITFASTDDETEGQITLLMSAPDLSLKQWAIRDMQEGTTVVALENVIAGNDVPNRLFRVPETGSPFLKN